MFARLLIEECAKICYELTYTTEGPSENAAYQRTLCGHQLKKTLDLLVKVLSQQRT
jgi:hypothetical protein